MLPIFSQISATVISPTYILTAYYKLAPLRHALQIFIKFLKKHDGYKLWHITHETNPLQV